MKDLLDKLSSYNLFNYLLPGVLFAVIIDELTPLRVIQKDIVLGVFVYYFLGSIISRIGSLVVEPILKRVKFIKFAPYEDFVKASKVDAKLEILSEANNMYRTVCALFISTSVVIGYNFVAYYLPWLNKAGLPLSICSLTVLYLFSYRKQTKYITKRVAVALDDE